MEIKCPLCGADIVLNALFHCLECIRIIPDHEILAILFNETFKLTKQIQDLPNRLSIETRVDSGYDSFGDSASIQISLSFDGKPIDSSSDSFRIR